MAKNSNKKSRRVRRKQKAEKQRLALERERHRDSYDQDLEQHGRVKRNFYTLLRDVCFNPDHYYFCPDYRGTSIVGIASTIREKKLGVVERSSLSQLIEVCKRSKILEENDCHRYVEGLVNLSKWSWMWRENPDFWHPDSKNTDKQFASLVRFLLCKYDVPKFMDKVWHQGDQNNVLYQEWFINLGLGENIRKQNKLPIPLTKKMAHHFLMAKDKFEITEAMRWGQIKGLGGDDRTAMAILATPLGKNFSNNEFWTSVIRFFMDNPMLDTYQYGPIYDFIYDQKYRNRGNIFVNGELINQGPPQPNFSMHRRDPNALLRQVETWHRNIRREQNRYGYRHQYTKWESCGIPGFLKEGKKQSVAIEEIITSKELYIEGEKMAHCVGSYVHSCAEHRCAIYSLRRFWDGGMERDATIEVDLTNGMVVQARKKHNRPLTNSDWSHINAWRKDTNLKLSTWLR